MTVEIKKWTDKYKGHLWNQKWAGPVFGPKNWFVMIKKSMLESLKVNKDTDIRKVKWRLEPMQVLVKAVHNP